MLKAKLSGLFTLLLLVLISPQPTLAVCPVCTVAVGAGLGLSRYLGIDDSISGIWVGGLVLSMSFWLISWLKARRWQFRFMSLLIIILMYVVTLAPLWISGIIGHPYNRLLGIDKLIFGAAVGTLAFAIGMVADKQIREIMGHQLFYYQKVVLPVALLTIMSVILFFVPK
ncbi:hypothetical protein M1563_00730 [Patescibacteria group bacterium]|nr:hypothetical protein [Patescibacteria group bacterium]MCL5410140.1 hypothetical protein [Patescibacteria group bacterium]